MAEPRAETGARSAVAVVGLAGRFPGARNPEELWRNLERGVESIRTVGADELRAAGVDPRALADPAYVARAAPLDDFDCFDAAFFELPASEARVTDPQLRLALECSWEVLEGAGYDPRRLTGPVGVFVGASTGRYLASFSSAERELLGPLATEIATDGHFLATRISYLLDLRGPSLGVQTACSSSLVAVHLASESLLAGECDLAIAGGVSVEVPHAVGYHYREGSIESPDGRGELPRSRAPRAPAGRTRPPCRCRKRLRPSVYV